MAFILILLVLVSPFFLLRSPFSLGRYRYTKVDCFMFFALGIFAGVIFIEFCKWLEQ